MVSEAFLGSVPDIEVLKRHAEEVNNLLGVTTMLADDGYRGDTRVNNLTLASNGGEGKEEPVLSLNVSLDGSKRLLCFLQDLGTLLHVFRKLL